MPLARITYSTFGGSIDGRCTWDPEELSTESRKRTGGGPEDSERRSTCANDSEDGRPPVRRMGATDTRRQRRSGWVSQRDASSGAACHMHLLM
eukprot:scaffold265249_cov26-Tisochrysis_lutea.AAC.1